MRIVRTAKQRDNLAKFLWDMAKVALTLFVIGPLARPESLSFVGILIGSVLGFTSGFGAYILDGKEVKK